MIATLYKTNGVLATIVPENNKDFQLKELYKLLECEMIQVVRLPKSQIMIIDEEGKLKHNPLINHKATKLTRGILAADDLIVGNAIVCHTRMLK